MNKIIEDWDKFLALTTPFKFSDPFKLKRCPECGYVKEEERNSLYQHINHKPEEIIIKVGDKNE